MLGKLVNILKSSRRVPFRAINKSRKSLFIVAATCIVLTIFATFFQSKDIVFFYDKLILTDESVQVIALMCKYFSIYTIKIICYISLGIQTRRIKIMLGLTEDAGAIRCHLEQQKSAREAARVADTRRVRPQRAQVQPDRAQLAPRQQQGRI
jgi:hypothetical protein